MKLIYVGLLLALTQLFYLVESVPARVDESTKVVVRTPHTASDSKTNGTKRVVNRRQAGSWANSQQPYNYNYGSGNNQANNNPNPALTALQSGAGGQINGQVIPPGFVPYIPPGQQPSSSNGAPAAPAQFGGNGGNQFGGFGNANGNGQFGGANQFGQPGNNNNNNQFSGSTAQPFRQFPAAAGSQNGPSNSNGFNQPPSNANGFNNQYQAPQFNQRQPPSNANGFNQRQPNSQPGYGSQAEPAKSTQAPPSVTGPGRNYYFYDPYYNPMQQTPDYGSFRTTTLNTLLMYTPAYTTQSIQSELSNSHHRHPPYNNGYGNSWNNNGYGWNNNNNNNNNWPNGNSWTNGNMWTNDNVNNGYGTSNNNNNGNGWTSGNSGSGNGWNNGNGNGNGWNNGNGNGYNWQGNGYYNNQNKQNYPQPINYNMQQPMPGSGSSYGLYNYYGVTTASPSIPLMTVANVADTYSKSFNPYYGMTTATTPSTPQNLWYSRYADLNYPIAAVPDSNYRNWKK